MLNSKQVRFFTNTLNTVVITRSIHFEGTLDIIDSYVGKIIYMTRETNQTEAVLAVANSKIEIMVEQSCYSFCFCTPRQLLLAEDQRKSCLA